MSNQNTANKYTRGIAEFVSGLTFEAIPAEVRQRVKLLTLDALGCGLYAAHLEWSRIMQRTLAALDRTAECCVWGTNQRLSAPHAALVNGTQLQGFEIDDGHRRGVLHPASVIFPALVAVCESRPGINGREFMTAAVAGYEIAPRVGLCMNPEHLGQGWHSAGTVGVFGAASGAARALKLNADKTVHALGIAGTQAAGLMAAQYGAMVKRMHAGRSSQSGLYGALLAEQGFTGIVNVFESEYGGFCTTFSRSNDRFRMEELTAGLGSTWETMNVALKFYSCVRSNHTTVEAIRELRAKRPFAAEEVEKVVVYMSQVSMDHCGWDYRPQGVTGAQLNVSYCVATLLLEGEIFVDQMTDDKIDDPARLALLKKVEPRHDPEITALGGKFRHRVRVEVTLKDGAVLKQMQDTARGMAEWFLTDRDIVDKFEKLVRHALPEKQMQELRDTVLDLENLKDTARLGRLLATG
jgi:aconitate decarboxylase